jgi:transcriptional regulator with XRE-family HTH domain
MTKDKGSAGTPQERQDRRTGDTSAGMQLGQMLSRLRFDNRWTLADVSRRTGVSISSLSKIENNQSAPAYSVLVRLAQGLGIDFAELIGSPTQKFATAARVITKADSGTTYATKMGIYQALAPELADKSMQPMVIDIPVRSANARPVRSAHKGEEFVYVLEGEVIFQMEPYAPALLSKGDTVYFDASTEHGFSSNTDRHSRILSVCLDRADGISQ